MPGASHGANEDAEACARRKSMDVMDSILDLDLGWGTDAGGGGAQVLDLGKVTANDNHVLRAIMLLNRSSDDMRVEVSSDREELNFQLDNPNLPRGWEAGACAPGGVGAGAGGAAGGAMTTAYTDLNELFNTIDYVDSVVVPAESRLGLVVTFLPSLRELADDDAAVCACACGGLGLCVSGSWMCRTLRSSAARHAHGAAHRGAQHIRTRTHMHTHIHAYAHTHTHAQTPTQGAAH